MKSYTTEVEIDETFLAPNTRKRPKFFMTFTLIVIFKGEKKHKRSILEFCFSLSSKKKLFAQTFYSTGKLAIWNPLKDSFKNELIFC